MHGKTAVQDIAVIGTGISGMSAAWLLSQYHKVTVYERDRPRRRALQHRHRAGRERRPIAGRYRLHRLQRGRPIPT